MNLLTVVTFLPLLGAVALALVPRDESGQHRAFALVVSLVTFLVSLGLWLGFDASPMAPEFQFEQYVPWVASIGIGYHVGLDGVALLLVMLTTVLTPIVILSAWKAVEDRVKEFMIALLVLETAMIGTFAALDLVLFYVFWELILVPWAKVPLILIFSVNTNHESVAYRSFSPSEFEARGARKVTTGITGLWQPSVHSDVAF